MAILENDGFVVVVVIFEAEMNVQFAFVVVAALSIRHSLCYCCSSST